MKKTHPWARISSSQRLPTSTKADADFSYLSGLLAGRKTCARLSAQPSITGAIVSRENSPRRSRAHWCDKQTSRMTTPRELPMRASLAHRAGGGITYGRNGICNCGTELSHFNCTPEVTAPDAHIYGERLLNRERESHTK